MNDNDIIKSATQVANIINNKCHCHNNRCGIGGLFKSLFFSLVVNEDAMLDYANNDNRADDEVGRAGMEVLLSRICVLSVAALTCIIGDDDAIVESIVESSAAALAQLDDDK